MEGAPWTSLADPSFTFSESELVDMLNMYVAPEEQGACRKREVLLCLRASAAAPTTSRSSPFARAGSEDHSLARPGSAPRSAPSQTAQQMTP
jgi:hypothetical protein